TGRRVWHFQGIRHDVWDWDFPAAPSLVTVTRGGRRVDAVAQITKYGYVYVLDRRTGAPLFPIGQRKVPPSAIEGERLAETQPYPLAPPPFTRQNLTADILTTRTPEAHAAVLERFNQLDSGFFAPPTERGTIVFPGFDGGGEWGGAAFDPATGLLYVNSNEMPWSGSHRHVECAVARADRRAPLARVDRDDRARGNRPHAGISRHGRAQHRRPGRVSRHRPRQRRRSERQSGSELAEIPHRRRTAVPRSRRLSADHAAVGNPQRDRSEPGHDSMADSIRRIPGTRGQRTDQHRQRQLRRTARHRRRSRLHRRDELRSQISRVR